jgi:hypothetical protein
MLTQSAARISSRLFTAPNEAASSSFVKYRAFFMLSLLRVSSLNEFPPKINRSIFELKAYQKIVAIKHSQRIQFCPGTWSLISPASPVTQESASSNGDRTSQLFPDNSNPDKKAIHL